MSMNAIVHHHRVDQAIDVTMVEGNQTNVVNDLLLGIAVGCETSILIRVSIGFCQLLLHGLLLCGGRTSVLSIVELVVGYALGEEDTQPVLRIGIVLPPTREP